MNARRPPRGGFIGPRDTRAMRRFDGRVVLVTGGSTGIGYATARAFLEEGASVGIGARRRAPLGKAAASLGRLGRVVAIPADVSRAADAKRLADTTRKVLGPIDVLVNNAGIFRGGRVHETSERDYDAIIDINVKGAFLVSKYVIPGMRRRKRGAIVNVSSDAGLVGYPGYAAYCASKGALVLLTKAMALDYAGDGIRVNAVCPGEVDTPMMRQEIERSGMGEKAYLDALARTIPMRRPAAPEEIARLIVFLASDEAAYMTGSAVAVDGGTTAG